MEENLPNNTEIEDIYIRPEEKIYDIATNKNEINWKNFLYELINDEGLDPWDVDLGILTQKYLKAIRELNQVDFEVSGKFLTIAVFLLKTKAELLVEKDLRGIEEKIAWANQSEDPMSELDTLEDLDNHIEQMQEETQKEKYSIKIRNPIARKRKVNIFDLIKLLEKTFEQSNKRRENFFYKNHDVKYSGPVYEKKPMDLKEIIEDLFQVINDEWNNKKGHVLFSHLTSGTKHKMGILEKFIPLLHLHNQNKVYLKQENHFDDIQIHKTTQKDS